MDDLAPEPLARPKFAHYLFDRRLTPRDVAPVLGCSHEQIRRVCLPFADPDFRRPSEKLRHKVAAWTRGEIGLADWAEPERVQA